MITTLLGTKINMTSTYDSRGRRVGATVLEVQPNYITQIKNAESKDGYSAVQLGMGFKKSVKKPQLGQLKKIGLEGKKVRFFKESRIKDDQVSGLTLGQEVKITDIFKKGDSVKVTATSKGRGFQGGVRRHGFHGGPKTHGQSDRHRAPGSIGSGTTPGRVYKGKKMAGHMGNVNVSYTGLEIVDIDKDKNLLTIKGGIPGPRGGLVIVERQGVIKGYTAPPEPEPEESVESIESVQSVESEAEVAGENTEQTNGDESKENEGGE